MFHVSEKVMAKVWTRSNNLSLGLFSMLSLHTQANKVQFSQWSQDIYFNLNGFNGTRIHTHVYLYTRYACASKYALKATLPPLSRLHHPSLTSCSPICTL